MALDSGFFDSTTATEVDGFLQGDKAKPASFMAAWIKNIIQTGYVPTITDCFKVTPGNGLFVNVAPGAAFINGYFVYDTETSSTELTDNLTWVCYLRLDLDTGEIGMYFADSGTVTISDYPVRAGNIYDLVLAIITIPDSTVTITDVMIVDKRNDFDFCGYCKMAAASNLEFVDLLAIDGKVNPDKLTSNIIEVSGNKTLALTDASTVQQVNSSSAVVITVPLNSAVEFPIDTELEIVRWGTGTVTITPTGGVTLNAIGSPATKTIYAQYGVVSLKKFSDNVWLVSGALT